MMPADGAIFAYALNMCVAWGQWSFKAIAPNPENINIAPDKQIAKNLCRNAGHGLVSSIGMRYRSSSFVFILYPTFNGGSLLRCGNQTKAVPIIAVWGFRIKGNMEKDDSVRKSPMDRQPIRLIVRSSIDSAYRFLYAVVKIRGLTMVSWGVMPCLASKQWLFTIS